MSDTNLIFDVNAARLGWTVCDKGWPDRLCVDKEGLVFFVEVKRQDEPLRPHQYKTMSLLESVGVKCFIAPDGDAEHLVPLDEWLVTASVRGRPAQMGTISRTTARSYGYKAKQLLYQADLGENTIGFPKHRVMELRARAQSMLRKAAMFWDGSDKEFVAEISVQEKASAKELERMREMFAPANTQAVMERQVQRKPLEQREGVAQENLKALKEVDERIRLEQLANEELAVKQGGNDEGRKQATDGPSGVGGATDTGGKVD